MKVKGNVSISQCPDPFIDRTKSQNSFRARQWVDPGPAPAPAPSGWRERVILSWPGV